MTVAAFDLLIRGGAVLDVDAGKSRRVDVATRGGRIVAVAPAIDSRAKRVIDARNLWVSPLLVDLTRDPPPADDATAALFGFVRRIRRRAPPPSPLIYRTPPRMRAFCLALQPTTMRRCPIWRALCAAENIAGATGGGWDSRRAARLFELAATFSILLVCEARDRSLAAGTAVCAGRAQRAVGIADAASGGGRDRDLSLVGAGARMRRAFALRQIIDRARRGGVFCARATTARMSAPTQAHAALLLTDDDGGDFDLRRRLWPPLGGDDDRAALTAAAAAGDISIRSDHCAPPPGTGEFRRIAAGRRGRRGDFCWARHWRGRAKTESLRRARFL